MFIDLRNIRIYTRLELGIAFGSSPLWDFMLSEATGKKEQKPLEGFQTKMFQELIKNPASRESSLITYSVLKAGKLLSYVEELILYYNVIFSLAFTIRVLAGHSGIAT